METCAVCAWPQTVVNQLLGNHSHTYGFGGAVSLLLAMPVEAFFIGKRSWVSGEPSNCQHAKPVLCMAPALLPAQQLTPFFFPSSDAGITSMSPASLLELTQPLSPLPFPTQGAKEPLASLPAPRGHKRPPGWWLLVDTGGPMRAGRWRMYTRLRPPELLHGTGGQDKRF